MEFIGYLYEKPYYFFRWLEDLCISNNKWFESKDDRGGQVFIDTDSFDFDNGGTITINVSENAERIITATSDSQTIGKSNISISVKKSFDSWIAISGEASVTQSSNLFDKIISAIHDNWPESKVSSRLTKFVILSIDRLTIIKWLQNYHEYKRNQFIWNAPHFGGSGKMYITDISVSLNEVKSFFTLYELTKNPILTYSTVNIDETEGNKVVVQFDFPELLEDFVTTLILDMPKKYEPTVYEPTVISDEDSVKQVAQKINLKQKKNKRPGRPHFADDIWAWKEVNQNDRPQTEVFQEWHQRIMNDPKRYHLVDLKRQYKKIIKADWYKESD